MKWIEPKYSKEKVKKAVKILSRGNIEYHDIRNDL